MLRIAAGSCWPPTTRNSPEADACFIGSGAIGFGSPDLLGRFLFLRIRLLRGLLRVEEKALVPRGSPSLQA